MRWLREPLLHFLLLGGGLFLVFRFAADRATETPATMAPASASVSGEREIVITPGLVENLTVSYERSNGRKPTAAELQVAIDEFVREEVLCREARGLGLDRDDTQVRRRLRQRMEFAAEATVSPTPPGDAELEAFLRAQAARFREPGSDASTPPALAAIRERVLRAWEQEQRKAAIDAAYQELRAKYTVRHETKVTVPANP